MPKYENTILTNICMVYDDDKILVMDRTKSSWPGLTFPGGHVEPNESFVESTIREIKEETGLTISSLELCGIIQWTPLLNCRYITICFKTNKFSGILKDSEEGHNFWIKKTDLNKYQLSNDFVEIYELMTNNNCSEYFCLRDETKDIDIFKKIL